jgi:endonuclease/exonuclease/phosphatase family metal-dependent hydrolase
MKGHFVRRRNPDPAAPSGGARRADMGGRSHPAEPHAVPLHAEGPALEPRTLRVASYNIHRCRGADGRCDPDRTAAVLLELDADVIGVQEVDSRYHILPGMDQVEHLARATNLFGVPGPTLTLGDSSYGNAMFTRRPVLAVRRLDLSVSRREPRGALDVDLDIDGTVVRVIVTHFGLGPWERRVQTATLLALLDRDAQPLTILCGDFNEWVPRWPTVLQLDARLGRSRPVPTFPARWPLLPLDRIWVAPKEAIDAVWVHRSALARLASDHLPLCAKIDLEN